MSRIASKTNLSETASVEPPLGQSGGGRLRGAISRLFAGKARASDSSLDNQILIVSPENIAFRYRVAGPFPRAIAFVLDLIICILLVLALVILAFLLSLALSALGVGGIVQRLLPMMSAIILFIYFLTWWFYSAAMETWMNGQTLAKRMMGMRVLSSDGSPINGLQATLRAILRGVELLPLVSVQALDQWIMPSVENFPDSNSAILFVRNIPTFLVGLSAMALSERFQRLGDRVCGTMVVSNESTWGHGIAKLEDPRASQLAAYIPANFVFSQPLSRALAAYVDRRRFFSQGRQKEIAAHIAEPLLDQFHLPKDTSYDLFLCALYYRAFVADQGQEDVPDMRLNEETRQFEGISFKPSSEQLAQEATHAPSGPAQAQATTTPADTATPTNTGTAAAALPTTSNQGADSELAPRMELPGLRMRDQEDRS